VAFLGVNPAHRPRPSTSFGPQFSALRLRWLWLLQEVDIDRAETVVFVGSFQDGFGAQRHRDVLIVRVHCDVYVMGMFALNGTGSRPVAETLSTGPEAQI
jgi:hypothetical protein